MVIPIARLLTEHPPHADDPCLSSFDPVKWLIQPHLISPHGALIPDQHMLQPDSVPLRHPDIALG